MPEPRCCQPLKENWPISSQFPDLCLSYRPFDPSQLDLADFARFDIPMPRGIDKRKAEFLTGRFCAQQALYQLSGHRTTPAVGADRAPCWPEGIIGSISHGQGHAAAITAYQCHWNGLGLDIEQHLSADRARSLVSELLTPAEQRDNQRCPENQRALYTTLTFSLKESLFKALYPLTHRRFYFQEAEQTQWPHQGQAQLRLLTTLSETWPAGTLISAYYWIFEHYLVTLVAIPGPDCTKPYNTISSVSKAQNKILF